MNPVDPDRFISTNGSSAKMKGNKKNTVSFYFKKKREKITVMS